MNLESFLDELAKIAAESPNRSLLKDFMGGVDPTGSKTFQYGMEDTGRSPAQSALRRGVGTAGGLLGGAIAVPAAIGGVIGAAQGASRGLGGILGGAWRGAYSPFAKLYRGVRAKKMVSGLRKGVAPSKGQLQSAHNMVGLEPLVKDPEMVSDVYSMLSPKQRGIIDRHVSSQVTRGLSGIGLSGLVGGGSAYLQYGKGKSIGQVMSPQQRAEASKRT